MLKEFSQLDTSFYKIITSFLNLILEKTMITNEKWLSRSRTRSDEAVGKKNSYLIMLIMLN